MNGVPSTGGLNNVIEAGATDDDLLEDLRPDITETTNPDLLLLRRVNEFHDYQQPIRIPLAVRSFVLRWSNWDDVGPFVPVPAVECSRIVRAPTGRVCKGARNKRVNRETIFYAAGSEFTDENTVSFTFPK